jgi:hypothetical protein
MPMNEIGLPMNEIEAPGLISDICGSRVNQTISLTIRLISSLQGLR